MVTSCIYIFRKIQQGFLDKHYSYKIYALGVCSANNKNSYQTG